MSDKKETKSEDSPKDPKPSEENGKADKTDEKNDKSTNGKTDGAEKIKGSNGKTDAGKEKPGEGESFISQVIHISIIVVLTAILISLWNTYQVCKCCI